MFQTVDIDYWLRFLHDLPVIDVRSPSEFSKGCIPEAFNLPLLSDAERAAVGTVYRQKSKEEAIALGFDFVTPKAGHYLHQAREISSTKGIIVHCWRGGMRSKSVAEHLCKNGISPVYVIENGYKAFRKKVLDTFQQPYKLRTIGGYTGSGKTEMLQLLKEAGEQVIDLEGIANHKGSAFGSIGCSTQPSVEQFENTIFWQWKDFDLTSPIWIEDESRNIGSVLLPHELYANIRNQTLYFLDIPRSERAKYLVEGYAQKSNHTQGIEAIKTISRKIGGQNAQLAIKLLESGEYLQVAEIALHYYDKSYLRGMEKRSPERVKTIPFNQVNITENTKSLIQFIEEQESYG